MQAFALLVCLSFGLNHQCTSPLARYETLSECQAKADWLEAWHDANVGPSEFWSTKCENQGT